MLSDTFLYLLLTTNVWDQSCSWNPHFWGVVKRTHLVAHREAWYRDSLFDKSLTHTNNFTPSAAFTGFELNIAPRGVSSYSSLCHTVLCKPITKLQPCRMQASELMLSVNQAFYSHLSLLLINHLHLMGCLRKTGSPNKTLLWMCGFGMTTSSDQQLSVSLTQIYEIRGLHGKWIALAMRQIVKEFGRLQRVTKSRPSSQFSPSSAWVNKHLWFEDASWVKISYDIIVYTGASEKQFIHKKFYS